MKALCVTSRSCSVLLDPDGLYQAREKRTLALNGEPLEEEYRSVFSLFDLEPDTEYTLESLTDSGEKETLSFRTKRELCTLDVRDAGSRWKSQTEPRCCWRRTGSVFRSCRRSFLRTIRREKS